MPVMLNFTFTLFSKCFEKSMRGLPTSIKHASYFIIGPTWKLRDCFVMNLTLQGQDLPALFPSRQLCNRRLSNEKLLCTKHWFSWSAILLMHISLSTLADILAAFHSCFESYSCILTVSQSVARNLGLFVNCLSN